MNLSVFDFDGTLVSTIDKPTTNEAAIAAGWNGRDWWGNQCSLRDVVFHENVMAAFRKARNDPNTHVAILTGRRGIIAWRVREILRDQGFLGKRIIPHSNTLALKHFRDYVKGEDQAAHEEYFTGDFVTELDYPKGKKNKPIDNTLTHKTFVIKHRLMRPQVEHVDLWDDRKDHFHAFMTIAKELMQDWNGVKSVTLHQVFPVTGVDSPYIVNHVVSRTRDGKIHESVEDGNKTIE